MNAVAGGGSFLTFPALVFAGLPSVVANASSTVALVPATLASVWAYMTGTHRTGLVDIGGVPIGRIITTSVAGGLTGAILLLSTPSSLFDGIVPWLLLLASLVFAFGGRLSAWLRRHAHLGPAAVLPLQFGLGVYGGYFGGAVGIMTLAAWSNVTAMSDCVVARMSAEQFHQVLLGNAAVATRLVELLVAKIRQMSERVFEVSALAVRERVRRELMRLAASGTRFGNSVVIRPAPTHYDIAARIGSHREAVTREFMRLEVERLIEVRRRQIRIVDIDRLAEATDDQAPGTRRGDPEPQ